MAKSRSSPRRGRAPQARANRHAGPPGAIPRLSEDDLLEMAADAPDILVLILDGVQDPHNLGACLRTADAAGVSAVVIPKHHAVAVTETVVRIACGAAESVPVVQVTNLARCLDRLKDEAGLRVVGAADEADGGLHETDLTGPLAFAMGAEGAGLRRLTREKCDALVSIPMLGEVECLNVSNATAVCLFEAVRQRLTGG
ncbi:MAG: 23S rRNA (guanosine(2251)-2'-O)-methyltransferase RlmB [Verrucomicrobiae bacterium]|nr:23S rRNA (guanosine(2251)-2'-O)-methyltransferase RlmB [Verrucomicrobiae bacterium]